MGKSAVLEFPSLLSTCKLPCKCLFCVSILNNTRSQRHYCIKCQGERDIGHLCSFLALQSMPTQSHFNTQTQMVRKWVLHPHRAIPYSSSGSRLPAELIGGMRRSRWQMLGGHTAASNAEFRLREPERKRRCNIKDIYLF